MANIIEISKSGRATCRTCRQKIEKGELRFGEETVNQYSSDEPAYLWHHLKCGAKKRPAKVQEALAGYEGEVPDRAEIDKLLAESEGKEKPTTFPYAERSPTSRSKCISCGEPIEKGTLRVAIEREVDTGSFVTKGAGYLHPGCAPDYVEDEELLAHLEKNSTSLAQGDLDELAEAMSA